MALSIIVMGAAGRMGSTIARLVNEADDLSLAAVLERQEAEDRLAAFKASGALISSDISKVLPACPGAVVIDFTAPEATMVTARAAAENGNPVIIGTTGFSDEQLAELDELASRSLVFRSANMSVGINVIMDILPRLTALLGDAYDVEMMEIHHNKKKDAPSGTALLLAEPLLKAKGLTRDDINTNRFDVREPRKHAEIGIQSLRGGDVVGVHTIYYMGPGERIEITHQAHSRENFANGALRAARWIVSQKPGRLYNMQDVLHD
ncbi:4-hydroxy-tetrahydrodipicolinate reductase [uncultured Mailhella sp.]|uniref:4-hydroxy-tetrahydrodipicolinate reductase n=1 Tax=uncultured Mailhella sp. TaxID=1981031 RepID=UPI0025F5EE68|nr:4-hydroxy-tetrahydrodipicolinate reductase [uncultured Mailhella sp.]